MKIKFKTLREYNEAKAIKERRKLERKMKYGLIPEDEEFQNKPEKLYRLDEDVFNFYIVIGLSLIGIALIAGLIWGGYMVAELSLII